MANNAASAALLKPTAERKRNVFPLDNQHVFSLRAGQVTPVKTFSFIPGDFFKGKISDTAITFPLNTAAFLKATKETSMYMVYNNAVWSLFNQYIAQRQDPKTSAFGDAPRLVEPRIPLADLYWDVIWQFYGYCVYTYILPIKARTDSLLGLPALQAKFMELLFSGGFTIPNFAEFKAWESSGPDDPNTFDFKDCFPFAQSGAFYTWFTSNQRLFVFEDLGKQNTNEDMFCDIVGHFRCYSEAKKLDMLGYGNIYPLMRICENSITTSLEHLPEDTVLAAKDVLENNFKTLVRRVFNTCFAVNISQQFSDFASLLPKYVNLYKICSYNSVFYHRFRNSFYDNKYNPRNYSLDFISLTDLTNELHVCSNYMFGRRFLDLEYHQWKKDLFTSVLPDTQFGAVQSVSMGSLEGLVTGVADFDNVQSTVHNLGSASGGLQSAGGTSIVSSHDFTSGQYLRLENPHTHSISFDGGSGSLSFDVIALKRAELLQDYMQTLMRAGNRTSDVFKALYGGTPSSEHEDDVLPRCIDVFGNRIDINPVVSTAATGNDVNGSLGDIAARASFKGDGSFKFNAGKNFGTLLVLTYIVPDASYNSYMLEKDNLELSPEQHFLPAYENFGLEPVYSDELNALMPATEIKSLGYAPRYYGKKSEVDKVHGAFCSLSYNFDRDALFGNFTKLAFYGDFNHWVAPRSDMQARSITVLRDFYVNPAVLDNVFVRSVSPDQADDQFIDVVNFDMSATRELTKIGLIDFV